MLEQRERGTVYIGIVTYHSLPDLPACLAGVAAQTYQPLRVAVLDNASLDGVAEWLAEYAPLTTFIQNQENVGFGRAHNQLIALHQFNTDDFYLALNPDVHLSPNYVEHLVNALADTSTGWATGKLCRADAPAIIYSAGHALLRDGYAFNIGYGLPDDGRFDQVRPVFGAPGAAALYTARLIRDIAPDGALFDPMFFLYAEDVDVDWRAQRAGWSCLFVPQAFATHRGSQPGPELRIKALANRYLSVLKNAYWLDLLLFNSIFIIWHCSLRLLLSPRRGAWLIFHLLRNIRVVLRHRTSPRVPRHALVGWFRWSKVQPSPLTLWMRFRYLVKSERDELHRA